MKLISIKNILTDEADVLASFELEVEVCKNSVFYWAEVRESPNGLQVDWSDELSSQLAKHNCNNAENCDSISHYIHNYYLGEKVEPVVFRAST